MSTARARQLRRNATDAERIVWTLLRQMKPIGFHFRRQVPIGRYYADFACHSARLIVEIDGDQHGFDAVRTYDEERDAFLRSVGYRVMRVANADVYQNADGVGVAILAMLENRLKPDNVEVNI